MKVLDTANGQRSGRPYRGDGAVVPDTTYNGAVNVVASAAALVAEGTAQQQDPSNTTPPAVPPAPRDANPAAAPLARLRKHRTTRESNS